MNEKRKDDNEEHVWFRSPRVFQNQGQWYYSTREGTFEGPFIDEARTREKLEAYSRTMGSEFAPRGDLKLVPEDN